MAAIDDPPVVLVSQDLLRTSRIALLARGAGVRLRVAAQPPIPLEAAMVIVDCNGHPAEAVAAIGRSVAANPACPVVAVVPHQDLATRRAARAAGAARCVANSALDTVLRSMLVAAAPGGRVPTTGAGATG